MEYKFDLQKVMTLHHIDDTVLTVSEMTGPEIKGKQYYINTRYRLAENKRKGDADHGLRMTKGFSIAEKDIEGLVKLLSGLGKGPVSHLAVCEKCTVRDDEIVLHTKESAEAVASCPPEDEAQSYKIR